MTIREFPITQAVFAIIITQVYHLLLHVRITGAHALASRAISWPNTDDAVRYLKAQAPRFTYSRWSPRYNIILRVALGVIA